MATDKKRNVQTFVKKFFRRFVFRTKYFFLSFLPIFLKDRIHKESLEFYRSRDIDENRKTTPPETEKIIYSSLWIVEIFTPSNIDCLYKGIEKLNLDSWRQTFGRKDLRKWVERTREKPLRGGFYSIGPFTRKKGGQYIGAKIVPFPKYFDFSLGKIYCLTPSLTCLVMRFDTAEDVSGRIEQILRKKRKTVFDYKGTGHSVLDPRLQKIATINKERQSLRTEASKWMGKFFPGYFSSKILNGEYPTAEFLIFTNAQPFFIAKKRKKNTEYLEVLGIQHGYYAWESTHFPDFKFGEINFRDPGLDFHQIITCSQRALKKIDMRGHGGNQQVALISKANDIFTELLGKWALLGLLSGFEKQLSLVRDSRIFHNPRMTSKVNELKNIINHLSGSVEIALATADLLTFGEKNPFLFREIAPFKPIDKRIPKASKVFFRDTLKETVLEKANWVLTLNNSLQKFLEQYGNLTSALENIKLQRRVTFLAGATAALTIVLVVLALTETGIL